MAGGPGSGQGGRRESPRGKLAGLVHRALMAGRGGDVAGRPDGDIRGMLLAAGGPSSKTRSGINLTRAAEKLNVSRRTVERWVKTADTGAGQRPSPANLKRLAKAARQAVSTKAGRAQGAAAVTRRHPRGTWISVTAFQGPDDSEGEHMRDRRTTIELTPEDLQALRDAWTSQGEAGVKQWLTETFDDHYLPGWKFGDIDDIGFGNRGGP